MTSHTPSSRSFAGYFESIVANVSRVVKGKDSAIELALVCLLSDGHLLIEDVPGVGKTSLAKAFARSIDASWRRVQFTPDLLPSDLVGVSVWSKANESFDFHPGPLFANIVLADEINRASPKTQSALLEAMEERQVTVDGTSRPLPRPFLVIATQNPVEQEGTYRLPESQLDRFLIRMALGYPDRAAETAILDPLSYADPLSLIQPVIDAHGITDMIDAATRVRMVDVVKDYIVGISHASRRHPGVALGFSPRATQQLARASRTLAAARGRDYVTPDDVKELAVPVLAHRLLVRHDPGGRTLAADEAVREIVASVPVPSGR